MSKATLKSIAQATGFSVTTVSRALGGYEDVNEETRQIIKAEAERQGYQPNLQARLLQGQRSQIVGLIIPTNAPRFTDPFFSEFVSGVGSRAAAAEFDLLLGTSHDSTDEVERYRTMVAGRRVDGFILARTRHRDRRIDYLIEAQMPFVVFGRTLDDHDYVYIDVDGVAGQRALTEHFIQLGHRRIAYIAPPEDLTFTHFRLQGYHEAIEAHHLPTDDSLIIHASLTEKAGRDAANILLNRPAPPTAIMTGNDVAAFGVMRAIQERGLRVGDDVAVGGFDDVPAAEHIHPGLTTVHQPIFEIGQQLMDLLLRLLNNNTMTLRTHLISPELVIRSSSGSPR